MEQLKHSISELFSDVVELRSYDYRKVSNDTAIIEIEILVAYADVSGDSTKDTFKLLNLSVEVHAGEVSKFLNIK
ncbi:hypothetical protein GW915_09300 [bacterium]|nr:hypothetical protein [bacterium]